MTTSFQGENGEIVYFFSSQESQPVYAASYFYINPTTGDITLSANLRGDPNTPQYQVRDADQYYAGTQHTHTHTPQIIQ